MALGALAKIGGKSRYVSQWAAKVIKGSDACGIYRAGNGFAHRLTKFYSGPNATLTEASKTLKDGRTITQKLWSWPDGSTRVLTQGSNGFFSFVGKNADGKVVNRIISHNPNHLVSEGIRASVVNGKYGLRPYANYVNGNNIALFENGVLRHTGNSASNAQYLVKQTIADAQHSFRCIG